MRGRLRAAGQGLDAALKHAERNLEAEADALLVEALRRPQQMDATCARLAARAAAFALAGCFTRLRAHGSTLPWRERMPDFDALNRLLGTPGLLARARTCNAG